MNKTNFLSLLILILVYGCGSGTRTVNITVNAEQEANSKNAVVVTIYQLTNADKFRYASFESLMKSPESTLGTDAIPNSKFEQTMVPGEVAQINEFEIKGDAVYLGIVADFHSPSKDGWQQLIPLESDFSELKISVHESSLSVAFD
jgi:type VI secretion system VasD/TssJ family lipoprotein